MDAIRLDLPSDRAMVELAEVVSGHVARIHEMAEDDVVDYGLAVRESVTNAIVHGNRETKSRRVSVEFSLTSAAAQPALVTRVIDEGDGFALDEVPDPLAPDNLLKPGGRGLLLMRAFNDHVWVTPTPAGGTEVRLVKCLVPANCSRNRFTLAQGNKLH